MRRSFLSAVTIMALAAPATAQQARFPDTPQGRLAAGFFAAVGHSDERVLGQFQETNFSQAALGRRSTEERLARNRQLRESAGALSLVSVVSEGDRELVVTASGANAPGITLMVTFTFTGGDAPKIDAVQIQAR